MGFLQHPATWIIGFLLLFSSGGVLTARKPVYAALSFLLSLLLLAMLYIQLNAQFIGVMQVIVYAGAIMVIFMFVIVLFQDAHQKVAQDEARCIPSMPGIFVFLLFALALWNVADQLFDEPLSKFALPENFGSVQSLGTTLYVDYFFPFEAVIMLFLLSIVGSVYIAKRRIGEES